MSVLKNKRLHFLSFAFLLLTVLSLLVCQKGYCGNKRTLNKGVKYENKDYHNDFLDEVKKAKIPYHIGDEGQIYYPETYQQKVDEITKRLDSRPNIKLIDPQDTKKLISILEKKKISYKIRQLDRSGKKSVLWEPKDDVVVKKIIIDTFFGGKSPGGAFFNR